MFAIIFEAYFLLSNYVQQQMQRIELLKFVLKLPIDELNSRFQFDRVKSFLNAFAIDQVVFSFQCWALVLSRRRRKQFQEEMMVGISLLL